MLSESFMEIMVVIKIIPPANTTSIGITARNTPARFALSVENLSTPPLYFMA